MKSTLLKTRPPTVVQRVRLPNAIEPGRYDATGAKHPDGQVFVGMGSGIVHIWATFPGGLRPGQIGEMVFLNAPGSYAVTGNFSEWVPGPSGPSPHAALKRQFAEPAGPYPPQHLEEGTWDITIQVYDVFDENGQLGPPEIVHATETNLLMPSLITPSGRRPLYMIKKYQSIFHGDPFEMHEIWGPGPNPDEVVVHTVKTAQSNLAVLSGKYHPESRTLRIHGTVQNCFGVTDKTGHVIPVTEYREIRYPDPDTKEMTVRQTLPDAAGGSKAQGERRGRRKDGEQGDREEPTAVLRDHSVGRRRRAPGSAEHNVPCVGEAVFELVALQRGVGVVKVVGRNASHSHLEAAAGMVMLGPDWLDVFNDTLRL